MIVRGRWWWTDQTRTELVPEGDPRAAFLAYYDGEEVGDLDAKQTGIWAKMQAVPEDKMLRASKNK